MLLKEKPCSLANIAGPNTSFALIYSAQDGQIAVPPGLCPKLINFCADCKSVFRHHTNSMTWLTQQGMLL